MPLRPVSACVNSCSVRVGSINEIFDFELILRQFCSCKIIHAGVYNPADPLLEVHTDPVSSLPHYRILEQLMLLVESLEEIESLVYSEGMCDSDKPGE